MSVISQCPVCQTSLRPAPTQLNADSHCSGCGGVWISADKLRALSRAWESRAMFVEEGPSADFCPECGPVPLDEGSFMDQPGLSCGQCRGVFMRSPLRERSSSHSRAPSQEIDLPSDPDPIPIYSPRLSPSERATERPPEHQPTRVSEVSTTESAPETSTRRMAPRLSHITPSKARITTPNTKGSKSPKRAARRDSLITVMIGVRDLIWFGMLVAVIIVSLLYWMNP